MTDPVIIELSMIRTVSLVPFVLLTGYFLKKKIGLLERFCFPVPVIGGIVFSVLFLIAHLAGVTFTFDKTLSDVAMLIFFTSVGYQASFRALKKGGKDIIILLFIVAFLVIMQNVVSVGLGSFFGIDPVLSLCTGSVSMIGGHGTAAAFGQLFEESGVAGASSVGLAAATFGMVCGSLIGCPLTERLIRKKGLSPEKSGRMNGTDDGSGEKGGKENEESRSGENRSEDNGSHKKPDDTKRPASPDLLYAAGALVLAAGIGTNVSSFLGLSGLTFPGYIGSMIAAMVLRNLADVFAEKYDIPPVPEESLRQLGNVALSFFLAVALMTMELRQLADLAVPLTVILFVQAVLMAFFVVFVVFRILGKDYDAAVMVSGVCGFGMGAIPNAMANMKSVTDKFGESSKAFLIIPLVGSLFIDLVNSVAISFFMSIL
ncbi:MAG: sodium/glutamate symporter [Methanosarcinaceae archaeon]|nr:sodium/glutamate symporter [Methanosarcinaceae archaeon]